VFLGIVQKNPAIWFFIIHTSDNEGAWGWQTLPTSAANVSYIWCCMARYVHLRSVYQRRPILAGCKGKALDQFRF